MSHFKSWIIFLVLSVVGVGVGAVSGQSCQSCLDSRPTHQCSGLENECPGGKRCRQHVTGRQGRLNCRDRCQHLKEINQLVSQRNVAWPKPFTCADRQLYFKTWEPMLDTGWRASCIFTDRHFVAGTADLNQAGQMKMSAIMRNNAVGQKAFYVDRDQPGNLSTQRLKMVKQTVDQWYGLNEVSEIAFTDMTPVKGEGLRTQNIGQLYSDQTPPPVIPVATGTGFASGG